MEGGQPQTAPEEEGGAEQAFEALRAEVTALRHGIELVYRQGQQAGQQPAGTAPDYTLTLGKMEKALGVIAARLAAVEQQPALAAARAQLGAEAAAVRATAEALGPMLAGTTRAAVERSLAGAGQVAAEAVGTAALPVLARLDGVAAQAGAAEASLRRVVEWASWRLLGRGVLVVAVLAGLLWLAHLSVWWWTARDVSLAQARKALLGAEIVGLQQQRDELKASRADLEQMGVLGKIIRCGPSNRPCIPVNEKAGAFGTHGEYRVIQGY